MLQASGLPGCRHRGGPSSRLASARCRRARRVHLELSQLSASIARATARVSGLPLVWPRLLLRTVLHTNLRLVSSAEGVRDKVTFRCQDAADVDLAEATVVFMYLLPRGLNLLKPRLENLTHGTRVASYIFRVPFWHPECMHPPGAAPTELPTAGATSAHAQGYMDEAASCSVSHDAVQHTDSVDGAMPSDAEPGQAAGRLVQVIEAPRPGQRKRSGAEYSCLYVYQVTHPRGPTTEREAQKHLAPGLYTGRTSVAARSADLSTSGPLPSAAAALQSAELASCERPCGALCTSPNGAPSHAACDSVNVSSTLPQVDATRRTDELSVATAASSQRLTREAMHGGHVRAGARDCGVFVGHMAALAIIGAFVVAQAWPRGHALGTGGTRYSAVASALR